MTLPQTCVYVLSEGVCVCVFPLLLAESLLTPTANNSNQQKVTLPEVCVCVCVCLRVHLCSSVYLQQLKDRCLQN